MLAGLALVAVLRPTPSPHPACGKPLPRAVQGGPAGGPVRLVVVASTNKDDLIRQMACRYEQEAPALDGRSVSITVVGTASGEAIDHIHDGRLRPDVWMPAASSWVTVLRSLRPDLVAPGSLPHVAESPQVIAMPRPMAEALGWPAARIGWRRLFDLARHPAGWARAGHPEWGRFKLGKTNIHYSTSALNATIATYYAATGRSSDLTVEDVESPEAVDVVREVESSVVHYGETSVHFLENLRLQDRRGLALQYISAVVLEEKSVWDYNAGNPSGDPNEMGKAPPPKTPLVAVYPAEGTLVADHPFVVLRAPWVDERERLAAEGFLRFLVAPEQQTRFKDLGWRDHRGEPGPQIHAGNGLLPARPRVLSPPAPEVLDRIRDLWPTYRKRARLLVVMDVSGSMNAVVPGTGRSKLEIAKDAALGAVGQLAPDDEVGLWVFSPSEAAPYREVLPIAPLREHRRSLEDRLRGLRASGGTKLYATIVEATRRMQAELDPARINGIILLSDGVNEDREHHDLTRVLKALEPPALDREVRIFPIAYGDLADLGILRRIAEASRGAAYDATDPRAIDEVFTEVVANF